jgi:hypothetical protein
MCRYNLMRLLLHGHVASSGQAQYLRYRKISMLTPVNLILLSIPRVSTVGLVLKESIQH